MEKPNQIIDEDGEAILPIESVVLDLLKTATQVKCFINFDEEIREINADYWNHEATNDEGIPDIVIAFENGTTIFYDDLAKLTIDNNKLKGHNLTIEII